MVKIQLFVATYNRPQLVLNAINSALNQNFDSFEIIVSDNSTNDETEQLINQIDDKRLLYRRRKPSMPVIDHLNVILKEVTSDFFLIFHDDDVMHFDMLEALYNKIIESDDIVAVGANAMIIKDGRLQNKLFYNRLRSDLTISESEQMIFAYLKSTFVPFSSYLYRQKVAKELRFNPDHGGKHCDAAFVIDLLSLGSVVFLSNPLMDYYKHEEQDSSLYNFADFKKLIDYISSKLTYNKQHPIIKKFRTQNIYGELKYNILVRDLSVSSKKYQNLIVILFKNSTFEYFPKIILITIFRTFLRIK